MSDNSCKMEKGDDHGGIIKFDSIKALEFSLACPVSDAVPLLSFAFPESSSIQDRMFVSTHIAIFKRCLGRKMGIFLRFSGACQEKLVQDR